MGVRDLNSRPPTPLSTNLSVGRCAGSGAEEVRVQSPPRKSRAPSLSLASTTDQTPEIGDKGLSPEALSGVETNSEVVFQELLTAHVPLTSSAATESGQQRE